MERSSKRDFREEAERRTSCEGFITKEECKKEIEMFENGKTPGNDGRAIEFYKKLWDVLADQLVDVFNFSFQLEEMTTSQRQAITTLIDKKGKDRSYSENWRPIPLVNVSAGLINNFLFREILKKRNHALENEVVLHLNIKPNHRVLEVGFGPGIGISAALKREEHGFGRVYGVDISEQMSPMRVQQNLLQYRINKKTNFLFREFLKKRNHALENEVVLHLNIKPNHRVLEVGFGPGIGISAALKREEHGFGRVYGVDISEQMVNYVKKSHEFRAPMGKHKLEIHPASVMDLPFPDNFFYCVFHTNCYYFWPDLEKGPGGLMATGLVYDRLKDLSHNGFIKYGSHWCPESYMDKLKEAGFTGVTMETFTKSSGLSYQVIFALN
ncbi:PREDICTED: uncharacterized protein LOC107357943 [Acropora digitifera]|uniref:uncharacterized protein LOC107357943 n=1 Tax=Acropora digitifera TaxID=70779 RepID=UPI00077AADDF|nr:PREDICTED: uncharacterized protein LOC107357943 [Acropora digitifera]